MIPEIKGMKNRIFSILRHYLPCDTPNNLKIQRFEKMNKAPEYIIILQLYTTNDDHIVYGS